jgi:hypothetical protein
MKMATDNVLEKHAASSWALKNATTRSSETLAAT